MEMNERKMSPYKIFLATMVISFFVMYAVMFLNVSDVADVYISTNRLYMSLLMVSPMALIMIVMMKKMYTNKRINATIMVSAVIVFGLAFGGLRNQTFIGDIEYMRGMIPHHSSAVLTSSHAHLTDPAVRRLADSIIASQEREITAMKLMIRKLEQK